MKGVIGVVFGGGGKGLTILEIFSRLFIVSLSKDQVKFSDDGECVELECSETCKGFSSAVDELKGNLETKL